MRLSCLAAAAPRRRLAVTSHRCVTGAVLARADPRLRRVMCELARNLVSFNLV